MKTKKKILLALISVLAFSLLVAGCGAKATPAESAQIYWDALVKNDIANAEKINETAENLQNVIDDSLSKTKNQFQLQFSRSGLVLKEDQMDEFIKAAYDCGKKATVKIEEVSNDGKTAQIKYTVNYIDVESLATEASNETVDEVKALGVKSPKEAQAKCAEIYLPKLTDKIQLAEPSSETVEKTINFVKENNHWVAEDKKNIVPTLVNMATNS